MNLSYIMRETFLMMCFAFVVGISFAYLLKALTFLFSSFGSNFTTTIHNSVKFFNSLTSVSKNDFCNDIDKCVNYGTPIYTSQLINSIESLAEYHFGSDNSAEDNALQNIRSMESLAEYHFGDKEPYIRPDIEMNTLYEFKHGKI